MKLTSLIDSANERYSINIYIEKSELRVQCNSKLRGILYDGSALDVAHNDPLEDEDQYIRETLIGVSLILTSIGIEELHKGPTDVFTQIANGTYGLNLFSSPWIDLKYEYGRGVLEVEDIHHEIKTLYPENGNDEIQKTQLLFKKRRPEIIIAFIEAYRFAQWANAVRYEIMNYMIEGNFS